jgi:murein DD-endopeptidase MepM/ murein hydrolase activator NlpD
MRYFVERDIGVFYVDARRVDEAVAWYRAQGIDFSTHLVKIAKTLVPQGKFTQAEALLKEASATAKTPAERIEVLMLQLELADKHEKVAPHLKASKELVALATSNKLTEEQVKRLDYQVAKKAAELQKSAASDLYKDVQKVRQQRAVRANQYFELLGRLRGGKTAEPLFFQGETLFAVGNFSEALKNYQTAHAAAVRERNEKIQKQSMEGMLASLGQPSLTPAEKEPYFIPVYTALLAQEPDSARARVIRKKLFKVHMDKKNLIEAEKIMRDYAARHPDDFKTQEAMLAAVMEEHRKKKDNIKIKAFVADINGGTFKVSKKYADALRRLMTSMQIEDAQVSLDKGDKSNALKQYLRIYASGESTERAKANAAYNLAALYYESGDMAQSYQWSVTALKEMDDAEAKQFADSFLTISTNLFLRQHFQQSADLGMRTVAKLCQQGVSAKNTAFKNAAFLWLADGKLEKAEETLELGGRCGIDVATQNEVRLEIAKELLKQKRWEALDSMIGPVVASPAQAPLTLPYLQQLATAYQTVGDQARSATKQQQVRDVFKAARARNADVPVEALDRIAIDLVRPMEEKARRLSGEPLEFPEQKFNLAVKAKLALLDTMTADVQEVQKTGSGKGIVKAYAVLVGAYEGFARQLRDFTPEGKPPEYVESFKKAMASVWGPVLETARKRRADVAEVIYKNSILAKENFALLAPQGAVAPRFEGRPNLVLMDRGGKR